MFCAHCGNEVETLGVSCPSCGKPASGAPSPPGEGRSPAITVLIVIGSVLVAVAIVGMISAIAIPNLLNAINRSRQKRTMADMRTIATAIEAHGVDHLFYPDAVSFEELVGTLEPVYVKNLPRADGWRNSFEYVCWQMDPEGQGCDSYVIASAARDRLFDITDLRDYAGSQVRTRYMDCDIVYSNGAFVQLPEGL